MNKEIKSADWGMIEYNKAWENQESIFMDTIQQKVDGLNTENLLVFCEHPHVYTLGKSGDEHNLLLNYMQLQVKDAVFVKTNRGGDITYHGFGQIVGYPIIDLDNFKSDIHLYMRNLEEVIIRTLQLTHLPIKSKPKI